MSFQFRNTVVESQTTLRLASDEFVTKVSCFNGPIFWYLISTYLHLSGKYIVSDDLLVRSIVWTLPEHHLIHDYANSEEI